MSGLRILLIEDQERMRAAVAASLSAFGERVAACDTVESGAAGLRAVASARYDVGLVDLGLPDMEGAEPIGALAALPRPLPSVAWTVFADSRSLQAAVRAGARGYLLKDEAPERILDALDEAIAGGARLSPALTGALFAAVRQGADEPAVRLSPRERELLAYLAKGCTYAECARLLGVGVGTVQGYVKSLYRRLDVCSKAEASVLAVQLGLLDGS